LESSRTRAGSARTGFVDIVNKYRQNTLPMAALLLLGSFAFVHLMALPVFADEGDQLRWIWRMIEAGEWLQPLGDGKPLEAWPMVPLVRLGFHPLIAARALHVLAGMIGAVLTYRLALQVSDRGTAFVSGALFAICPFVVYLQRLALSDMFMCVAGIWVLASILEFIESPTGWHTVMVAVGLPLAALSKLPVGFVFLISMPLAFLLMPSQERRHLLRRPGLIKMFAAYAPAALLAAVVLITAIIRMQRGQSPGFGLQDLVGIGAGRYRDIAAVMGVPRPGLIGELTAQLSWPVTVIGLIGLAAGALLSDWRQRWLFAVGALPMLLIGLFAQFWFSRYLLFTLPPLIVCAVSGWRSLALHCRQFRLPVEVGALAVCAGYLGHQSALIIFDPVSANWSPVDRFQYFEAPGSGFGYPEAAKFVVEAPVEPRMIYSLDGYSAYQLLTYLPAKWIGRVKSIYYGGHGEALRSNEARLRNLMGAAPVWIIVPEQLLQGDLETNFGRLSHDEINLRQIAEFAKPGLHARLAIYEVAPR
jgi:Dolichyl-phosphate-mannose-protein mannosyltransferase